MTLDPDFWNSVSETQRELLTHHELGHCVLYRPHRSTLLDSGAYASIMYPVIMSSSTYLGNYDYYREELFNQSSYGVFHSFGGNEAYLQYAGGFQKGDNHLKTGEATKQ